MGVWSGELGFDPEAFWRQTPRIFSAILEGRSRSNELEHNERAWLAHTTAALGRVKKFPKLKDLLSKRNQKKPGPKPWQEQLAIAKAWTAAFQR